MNKILSLLFLTFIVGKVSAQQITLLEEKPGISIRGLSVLNNSIAWISGTKGTIAQTSNGGKTWQWLTIPNYTNRDFRDIELIDAHTAIIMAIDTPAVILKTSDNGKHWEKVLEDKTPGMFLDAMSQKGKKIIVVGDPIQEELYVVASHNLGKSWNRLKKYPSKYGCFASSGTNIAWLDHNFFIVTGGFQSHLWYKNKSNELPLTKGKETTGANSIAINPYKKSEIAAIIVGGDFNNKERSDSNCILVTRDFLKNQNPIHLKQPLNNPKGYKSCVEFINNNTVIATGTSGTDISLDQGYHWKHISDKPFHVIQKAKNGSLILLAGPNGNIAKLEL